jgi:16S rRNA (adenine1518-N6/adenine1519-N6)-dimethyltransferase
MLVDAAVLENIIGAASITKNETACEAGAGLGALTSELCRKARKVISFEVDRALYETARKKLEFINLELVHGDIFRSRGLEFDVFVSNLPYSRSRDAIEWLAVQKFDRAVVMVQKEFAEKLSAPPGSREYRAISALAGYCFDISHIATVDRDSFSPPPKVGSVVLKILPRRRVDEEIVKGINWLFSRRNRKASSVARDKGILGFAESERIDQLQPLALIKLAGMICDIRAS